ncbi:hypothetical protein KKG48_01425 [Patescibacteria group bacterium]|nr:hypothetical protein [Patescibacteria group bacterium]MCG2694609.1 hypothetical protein [Candidatus Parcubacteria bacterium]
MIDNKISFIPKKDISTKKDSKGSISIFLFVASVCFVVAVVFSFGVFLYKSFLERSIESSIIMLEKERENFDVNSIQKLTVLDKRLTVAEELLNKHIDLTRLFDALGKDTLKNIRFKNFSFSLTEEGADISMDGVAKSYSSVALQSDRFSENPSIINPIFSDLDVDAVGDIIFKFSASVDKGILSYANNF